MAETPPPPANAAQVDYWNAVAGETWSALQDKLDSMLGPLGEAAIAALAPQLGERVLDIGCGCGQTTQWLAALPIDRGQNCRDRRHHRRRQRWRRRHIFV